MAAGAGAGYGERMARTDFRTPRLYVEAPLAAGASSSSTRSRRTILSTCCGSRRTRACSCSMAATANSRARSPNPRKNASLIVGDDAAARGAAGRRLSVRAAQARPPRLYGAKGGGDGRAALHAGPHPPHPGRARQPRAPARQRDRSLRAMRRDLDARGRARPRRSKRRFAAGRADRLMVFCDEEAPLASPLDALADARAPNGVGLLSARKAASTTTSGRDPR